MLILPIRNYNYITSIKAHVHYCKVEFNQSSCWFYSVSKACNLAISNHVFKWELCKGSVWESVKKCSRLCSEAGTRCWILRVAHGLQSARRCTRVKHVEKLNHYASCSITWQKVQTGHSVSSRLGLATLSSCETKSPVHSVMEKLTLRIPFLFQYKYPLYPQNIESF